MRAELQDIELIESYLLDKLSSSERLNFEKRLNTDSNFNEAFVFQENLNKALYRKAMVGALNKAHVNWINKTPSLWLRLKSNLNSIFFSFLLILSLGILLWWANKPSPSRVVASSITSEKEVIQQVDLAEYKPDNFQAKLTNKEEEEEEEEIATEKDLQKNENIKPKNKIQTNAIVVQPELKKPKVKPWKWLNSNKKPYLFLPTNSGTIVDSISSSSISIKPNAFLNPLTKKRVTDSVRIVYKEFRTKGDMVLSNIPMHWFGMDSLPFSFHSEGMFSIFAFCNDTALIINPEIKSPLTISFRPNGITDSLSLFYLKDSLSNWKFIQKIEQPSKNSQVDSFIDSAYLKALKTPFKGENVRRWSAPQLRENGVIRYGFWGRLIEYIQFRTVYGDSIMAFGRVFTEKRFVSVQNRNPTQIDPNSLDSATNEVHNILINRLGYYNYDKLIKSPRALRPYAILTSNSTLANVTKIVAVEKNTNAAYHFYTPQLCLRKGLEYDFFAFTADNEIFHCSRDNFKTGDFNKDELIIDMIDVTKKVKNAADIDRLLTNGT